MKYFLRCRIDLSKLGMPYQLTAKARNYFIGAVLLGRLWNVKLFLIQI